MDNVILTSKFCHKCESEKPASDFAKNKNRKDGLNGFCKLCVNSYSVGNTAYKLQKIESHQLNKERNNTRTKNWRAENKDYAKKYMENWILENKHRKAAADKAWRIANKDYIRVAYKERMLEKTARRVASKLQAVPKWANKKEIIEIYKKAQALIAKGIKAEVDHIVPIRSKFVCGLHVIDNLQILTKEQNLIKGNRFWDDMP